MAIPEARKSANQRAWLMIATDDPVLLGAGYEDEPSRHYSWDSRVPNHGSPSVGDAIVLWDRHQLIGAGIIERIDKGKGEKVVFRCPGCNKSGVQTRKTKEAPYYCPRCKIGVNQPEEKKVQVSTYCAYYESTWVDLDGKLDGSQLRELCEKPRSQHSIRAIVWEKFVAKLGGDFHGADSFMNRWLSLSLPDEIPASHIQKAFSRIDIEGISPHSDSSTYDVVHEGRKYPPIAVVAFALEALAGQPVAAGTIRGGRGTQAFQLLAAAGFDPVPKYFEPSSDNQQLEERVEAIRQNEPLDLPPEGNRKPAKRRAAESEVVERDPQVKRWVLDTAVGICELCGERSPFHSKAPGHPLYLEVHHVVPLKKDGPDTVCNAVALCPNCHTRCHQSVDAADATGMLYERVGRLVRPS